MKSNKQGEVRMFRKNDKSLINARWVTLACIILLLIAAVAAGVVLCGLAFDQTILEGPYGEGAPPVDLTLFISGIVIILVFTLLCVFAWTFANLRFTQMFDLKLIRNKLYGIYDPILEKYVSTKKERKEIRLLDRSTRECAKLFHVSQTAILKREKKFPQKTSKIFLKN